MIENVPYGRHELDEEDIEAVIEVLKSGSITQGQVAENFGKALAEYAGCEFGVVTSSGTAALHLAVAALDIRPGDEVITTPMTFCATANAILYQGGTVKFVDIDEKTLNIDSNLIEESISTKTKAILPVDFRGHPASLPEIKEIADRNGLMVLEDGSHAIGSNYKVDNTIYKCGDGVHADMCTYSFHPVKHITTGEGGAVLTNSDELYRRLVRFTKHGIDRRVSMFDEGKRIGPWFYDMECLGFNYRLTEFQAALGISQLKKIDQIKDRRRQIVSYYNDRFSGVDEFILPYESSNVDSNFHLYVLQVKDNKHFDRYDFYAYLHKIGYRPMVHYIPVHLLSYYRQNFGYQPGDFPRSERYYSRAISIPLFPSLTDRQVEKVVDDVIKVVDP